MWGWFYRDFFGNTIDTAKNVTIEHEIRGGIDTAGDWDWVRPCTSYNNNVSERVSARVNRISAYKTGSGAMTITVHDASGTQIGSAFNVTSTSAANQNVFTIPQEDVKNVRYIRFSGGNGVKYFAKLETTGFILRETGVTDMVTMSNNVLRMIRQVTNSNGFFVDRGYLDYDRTKEAPGWKPISQTAMDVLMEAINSSLQPSYYERDNNTIIETQGIGIFFYDDYAKKNTYTHFTAGKDRKTIEQLMGGVLIHEIVHTIRYERKVARYFPNPYTSEEVWTIFVDNMIIEELNNNLPNVNYEYRYDGSSLIQIPGTSDVGNNIYGDMKENMYKEGEVKIPTTLWDALNTDTKLWKLK